MLCMAQATIFERNTRGPPAIVRLFFRTCSALNIRRMSCSHSQSMCAVISSNTQIGLACNTQRTNFIRCFSPVEMMFTLESNWWRRSTRPNFDRLLISRLHRIDGASVTPNVRLYRMLWTNKLQCGWRLCSPNEDFGTVKNVSAGHFVSTFHTLDYSIWANSDEKCLQNVLLEYFSTFGYHKDATRTVQCGDQKVARFHAHLS